MSPRPRDENIASGDTDNDSEKRVGMQEFAVNLAIDTFHGFANCVLFLLRWSFFVAECSVKSFVFAIKSLYWSLCAVLIFVFNFVVYFIAFVGYCLTWFLETTKKAALAMMVVSLIVAAISPVMMAYALARDDKFQGHFTAPPIEGSICISTPVICKKEVIHIGSTRNFLMFVPKEENDEGEDDQADVEKSFNRLRKNAVGRDSYGRLSA